MKIALATSAAQRDKDVELPLIVASLADLGHHGELCVWDDPDVDWNSFDATVVRSCWDYTGRRDEFLTWAQATPHLHNAADVIDWNTDKIYLRDLHNAGIPVIETRWDVRAGDDLGDADEWVCKPSISAGSKDTARWGSAAEVYRHSEALIDAGRTSMVQPYIGSVDDEGETALLYIGGVFSHAIRKGPLLARGEGVVDDRDGRESITPREPTSNQRAVADAAVGRLPEIVGKPVDLLYARVDLVTAPVGDPLLIELELTEPSLFLQHSIGGAARLAAAVTDIAAH